MPFRQVTVSLPFATHPADPYFSRAAIHDALALRDESMPRKMHKEYSYQITGNCDTKCFLSLHGNFDVSDFAKTV